jgi:hypothetical protein
MTDYDGILTISGGRTKRANSGDTVNVTSDMNIKAVLKFEGATDDDYETTLAVTDPTANRTITFPDEDGDVALLQSDALPKAISFPVKNPSTTTALTKGQIVYISGYSGNKPEISLAQSNSSSTMPAFGFVAKDIAAEGEGYIISSGLFKGIDTNSLYSEGDTIYVSSTTAGEFVNTPPAGSGTLIQNIGKIIRADSSNGELLVGGAGRTNATPNLDNGKFFIGNGSNQSSQSNYTLPLADGNANQVLQTNGSGALSFATISSGGIASVAADDTPQLGGDLDVNGNKIHSSSGNVKIETGTGGGYIDITTTASSNGNIYLRPQSGGGSGDGNVGIGNGFTPGSSKPTFTLQVKDDNNTTFVSRIENANTGTSTSCIELVLNPSTTNVDTTNKFLSFKKGTSEKGYLAGDGSGGLQLTSESHLDIKSSGNINIKSSSATIAEFDTTSSKFLFGADAVSETTGAEHFKIKENATATSSGDSGLLVVHNTHNSHSTRVLTLKGGNQSSTQPSANTRFIDIFAGNGTTVVGGITGNGSGGIQLTTSFTAMHPTIIAASEVISLGLIVESTGIIWANNQNDVSTAIPKVTLTNTNNSKKVFGVISSTSSDYEGYVAAWGVGESESQITVNSIGEGKVWVTNINGSVENGDYVTTSEISGHGRLQDDDLLHNYTVAKCTETVDWSSVSDTINHNGVDYKKYLIGCTYHCG